MEKKNVYVQLLILDLIVGDNVDENIMKILETYTSLFEATGDLLQQEKTACYCWQWKTINNRKVLKNYVLNLYVKGYQVKILNVSKESKTLRVYLSPSL